MIRFHFLGTAAGVPDLDRLYSGTAVEISSSIFLIDAGDGIGLAFSRSGLDWKRVKALFITHEHGDHTGGIAGVLSRMPAGAVVKFSKSYSCEELKAWSVLYPHLKFEILHHNLVSDVDGVTVTALKNDHLASNQSYSFEIKYQYKRILYSGDIGNILLERYFWDYATPESDLLIMESAHIMPKSKLLEKLLTCRCRQLVFNHIWRETVLNFDMQEYLSSALPYPVRYSTDGSFAGLDDDGNYFCGERSELPSALKPFRRFTDSELEELFSSQGIPSHWHILGAFENRLENSSHTGLYSDLVKQVVADTDFNGTYCDKYQKRITWQSVGARDMTPRGLLPFAWIYSELEMTSFAATDFSIETSGNYRILWGSDDGCRMFIDGNEVLCDDVVRGAQKDQNSKVIKLEEGSHRLVVVHATARGGWGVHFRIIPA